jgi:hypothetical protein
MVAGQARNSSRHRIVIPGRPNAVSQAGQCAGTRSPSRQWHSPALTSRAAADASMTGFPGEVTVSAHYP